MVTLCQALAVPLPSFRNFDIEESWPWSWMWFSNRPHPRRKAEGKEWKQFNRSPLELLIRWYGMVDCGGEEALVPVERRNAQLSCERMHPTGNGRRLQQCQSCSSYRFIFLLRSRGRLRIIVMSMYVCLCVCPLASLENRTAKLHQIFVCVAYGCGSVLLRRRYDMLCISGFVDDVTFSNNDPMTRRQNTTCVTAEIPTELCPAIKTGSTYYELCSGWNMISTISFLYL